MQTARVTVLMTPDRKAALEQRAARMGVSSGEYVPLAVDNYDPNQADEAELAALVDELNMAIPAMKASLKRSADRLEDAHRKVDRLLREWGHRE